MRPLWLICLAAALVGASPVAAQQSAADALNERAKAAMVTAPSEALALATQAERRASSMQRGAASRIATATALWLQSEALIRSRDPDRAALRITRALRLIADEPRPTKLRGDLLLARAGVQQSQTRPAEALASLQEAFKIFGATSEKRSQSIALQTMAILYTEANDLVSAEKYFGQASEIY